MGRRSWFSSVKKALTLDFKRKETKRAKKSKKKWFGKARQSVSELFDVSNPHPRPQLERDPREVAAVIKIQTAYRGYQARRALRALRGLVRLKSLIDGPTAERQTAKTLKSLQNLSWLQSQIQSRRMKMLDENRALQRELLLKQAMELDSLRMAEEWDDSPQSKEETDASLLHKYEAAVKRERALAYSYTHQKKWKKSSKLTNILFMDPTNPHWGWSWLERWVDGSPVETKIAAEKKFNSLGTAVGEIMKSFARHHLKSDNPPSPAGENRPYSHQALVVPPPKAVSSLAARKLKHANHKVSVRSQEDDSRSMLSIQSERFRRHSIAGSPVRDDESLKSTPPLPSYMTPTRSAKARSKLQSPLGMVNKGKPGRESASFLKKRLSFPHP